MRATIMYDLTKEDDVIKYQQSIKATEAFIALYEITALLRNANKHNVFAGTILKSDDELVLIHEVYKQVWDILQANDIDPFSDIP